MVEKVSSIEMLYTPDWHWTLSNIMGDITGEIGYVTDQGTIHLLGKKDPDLTKSASNSAITGPVLSITACQSLECL